jgi:hypothetical protein
MISQASIILTSSATDLARNFRIALARCTFTVTSLTPKSAAICLFSAPAATWAMTSRSRPLSESKLSRKVAFFSSLCAFPPRPPSLIWGAGNGVDLDQVSPPRCPLWVDCVDKRFDEAKRAILIQEGGLARNIDSKSATPGSMCCGSPALRCPWQPTLDLSGRQLPLNASCC